MINIDAGPELDAMIAQELFGVDEILGIVPCERDYDGWHWSTAPCNPDCEWAELRPLYVRDNQCSCDLIGADDEYPPAKRLGHYWTCLESAPLYSSHILWAWEVVKKLRELNIDISINSEAPNLWSVILTEEAHNKDGYNPRLLGEVEGISVPHCIGLAAVRAMERVHG